METAGKAFYGGMESACNGPVTPGGRMQDARDAQTNSYAS